MTWSNSAKYGKKRVPLLRREFVHSLVTLSLFLCCLFLYISPPSSSSGSSPSPPLSQPSFGAQESESEKLTLLRERLERKEQELQVLRKLQDKSFSSSSSSSPLSQDGKEKLEKELEQKFEEQLKKYRKRDKALLKSLNRREAALSEISRDLLKRKFGTQEPYQARMIVELPESMGSERGEILLEMAPSDLVPTGVLYFMTQVELGLWDGCSFIRNAHHVLQASPQDTDRRSLHKKFRKAMNSWESIPFQEYSERFPHVKYTLGLAGRPGGPDFYISTVDNTRNHGPGGQGSYDLPEEADTCFGRVVKGFDVVDKMHKAPKKNNGFEELVDYIKIIKIELVL